jgi:hypothetical protein
VFGITMPASQAGALSPVPELSGTASGLSGFVGTLLAASHVGGGLPDGTPLPVAMVALARPSLAAAAIAFQPAR